MHPSSSEAGCDLATVAVTNVFLSAWGQTTPFEMGQFLMDIFNTLTEKFFRYCSVVTVFLAKT